MNREIENAATKPAPVATATAATDVLVAAVTTSASAETDVFRGLTGTAPEWYKLKWDADVAGDKCYVTIGALNGVGAPDETATSGAGRALLFESGDSEEFEFDGNRRALRTKGVAVGSGTGAGMLRIARVGLKHS